MPMPGRSLDEVDALAAAILADLRTDDPSSLNGLFTRDGKPPPRVVWAPTAATPMHAGLRHLLDYWQGLRADGLPRWRDVRIEELRPVVGRLTLVDPVEGGRDFRYAVYGSGVADVVTRDYQGETTREMAARTGTASPILYLVLYSLALERRQAVWSWTAANRWQEVEYWERLVLPVLGRSEGELRFVVGMIPGGKKRLDPGASSERDRVLGDRPPVGRAPKTS
jgi:hypothetical protein